MIVSRDAYVGISLFLYTGHWQFGDRWAKDTEAYVCCAFFLFWFPHFCSRFLLSHKPFTNHAEPSTAQRNTAVNICILFLDPSPPRLMFNALDVQEMWTAPYWGGRRDCRLDKKYIGQNWIDLTMGRRGVSMCVCVSVLACWPRNGIVLVRTGAAKPALLTGSFRCCNRLLLTASTHPTQSPSCFQHVY